LAAQSDAAELAARFAPVAAALRSNESTINEELLAVQGKPVDMGGYYRPDNRQDRCGHAPERNAERHYRRAVVRTRCLGMPPAHLARAAYLRLSFHPGVWPGDSARTVIFGAPTLGFGPVIALARSSLGVWRAI
jgi:hypothetical protein